MGGEIINAAEVSRVIQTMKPNGRLFECRIIYNSKQTYSGYFTSAGTLLSAIEKVRDYGGRNVYITLNKLNPQCYARIQHDRFIKNAEATTSDGDVESYDWLLVDLDPKRPAKTSATDEQIEAARVLCGKIMQFMSNVGFEQPIIGFSGNGYHLLYKINLANTNENKGILKTALEVLSIMFSDSCIDVDVKNFNPSRVCKLYGTKAQKGAEIEDAPHRMSQMLSIPSEVKTTDKKYIEKLASYYPKEERPQSYNRYLPREFDLDGWLSKYGLAYKKDSFAGGDKYVLDHCPFDPNHKGKDAVIFKLNSGALSFNCFHASCSDKKWRDVRLLYEPDAYEKRQREYEKKIYSKSRVVEHKKASEQKSGPMWLTAKDILALPRTKECFVRTGVTELDRRLRGLRIGAVSVVSGLRGSAKSTWLSGVVLECCQNGDRVGVYSGELSAENFMRWTNRQAAGKGNLEPTQYKDYYNVSERNQSLIAEWMGKNFSLYNNKYGNDFQEMKDEFRRKIESDKLELLILDNLMAFDISGLSDNKYEAQTAFVWSLHELADEMSCHIMFVAHPRKAMGFLRLDDISGTADLGNAVDNAFIIHRNNNDFQRLSKQMFGWKESNPIYQATNVIEIAKDRDGGNQDIFIPLWYETETKRLKNSPTENKIYGWKTDEDPFIPIAEEDIVFD